MRLARSSTAECIAEAGVSELFRGVGAAVLPLMRESLQGVPQLLKDVAKTCTQFCTPDPSFLSGTGGSAAGLARGTQCVGLGQECRYLASFDEHFVRRANDESFSYPADGETELGICVTAQNWGDCTSPKNTPRAFWRSFLPPIDASSIDDFVPGCFSFAQMRTGYETTL